MKTEDTPVEETAIPEEGIEAAGAGEMDAPVVEEKPKHRFADRLSQAYPDRQFASDEEYDTALDEYLGDLEGYRERGETANQKLVTLFEAEPQIGQMVRDMLNGATFREALARHFTPEEFTAMEGDPDYEGWSKNKLTREESIAKRKQFEQERDANLEFSSQAISEFATENGMSEDDAAAFLAPFDEMLTEINSGKITKDTLKKLKKMMDYDNDVTQAKTQGEISGRNQNIVAKRETAPKGDGLPTLSKSSETPDSAPKPKSWIDGLVEKEKKRQVT